MNKLYIKLENLIGRNNFFYLILLRSYKIIRDFKNLLIYKELYPTKYIILKEKKLIYINNPKVACTSIKRSFLDNPDKHTHIHRLGWSKKSLNDKEKEYYIFTFVRNPFKRLVSCYKSKLERADSINNYLTFDSYLFGKYNKIRTFEDFIKNIVEIPHYLADEHFKSQYHNIYNENGVCKANFVGKLENINNEFGEIQRKYNLNELPHYASTQNNDWMKYYDKELLELVFRKYKKSITTFNYIDEYKELKVYLENN